MTITTARRALTITEGRNLLATCAGDSPLDLRDRALLVLGLETGMKSTSMVSALIEGLRGFSPRDRMAHVPLSMDVTLKGTRVYTVPLSNTAMRALLPWLRWLATQRITGGPVFRALTVGVVNTGKAYTADPDITVDGIYKITLRRMEQAGLIPAMIHPQVLRATFLAWRVGVPPHVIGAITGRLELMNGSETVDQAKLAVEARFTTPEWLNQLVADTVPK